MHKIIIVGAGGFVGSVARYLICMGLKTTAGALPWSTIVANIIGCFLIGFGSGLAEYHQLLTSQWRLFLLVGLLGGFTTFSTFGHDTIILAQDAQHLKAIMNVVISITTGLCAVWLGIESIKLGTALWMK